MLQFDDGRARIRAKETALSLLGLSSTGWGPEAFISSAGSIPSSPLETMRGKMEEVSKGLKGHLRLPKGTSTGGGACRTPNISGETMAPSSPLAPQLPPLFSTFLHRSTQHFFPFSSPSPATLVPLNKPPPPPSSIMASPTPSPKISVPSPLPGSSP